MFVVRKKKRIKKKQRQSDKVWKAFSMLIHNWKRLWVYDFMAVKSSSIYSTLTHSTSLNFYIVSLHYWKTLFLPLKTKALENLENSFEFILVFKGYSGLGFESKVLLNILKIFILRKSLFALDFWNKRWISNISLQSGIMCLCKYSKKKQFQS